MNGFKFQVGEVVAFTAGVVESELMEDRTPTLVTVISRLAEECHGGIQYHYHVQSPQGTHKLNEVCLMSRNDPRVTAVFDAFRKNRAERKKLLNAWGEFPKAGDENQAKA